MYGTKNSAEECQALCKATSGCKWFNWDKDKKCWLKTQKGSQMNAKGAVTGPSQCQGIIQNLFDLATDHSHTTSNTNTKYTLNYHCQTYFLKQNCF